MLIYNTYPYFYFIEEQLRILQYFSAPNFMKYEYENTFEIYLFI